MARCFYSIEPFCQGRFDLLELLDDEVGHEFPPFGGEVGPVGTPRLDVLGVEDFRGLGAHRVEKLDAPSVEINHRDRLVSAQTLDRLDIGTEVGVDLPLARESPARYRGSGLMASSLVSGSD